MDKRYVKCSYCNKRIYFGEPAYRYKGYCGVCCSTRCFTSKHGLETTLDQNLAEDCCCTVFDDDKRKRELMETMERLKREMDQCQAEFQSLNNTK